MNSKYRYLLPNGLTFGALACGVLAILMAASNHLTAAGALVLTSYVLDLADGYTARRLRASSEFGLQLDSLADMVSLGAAPAVLVFVHLQASGLAAWWIWPFVVLFPLAGAFRLARFNLLPSKTSNNTDSVGLTISTGGALVALAVLADRTVQGEYLPDWSFLPLLLVVALLMVSTIAFPSFYWIFGRRRTNLLLVALIGGSLLLTSFFGALFLWLNAYLGISLARAGVNRIR